MAALDRWEKELLDVEGHNIFEQKSTRAAHYLLFTILCFLTIAIIWASNAMVDEVTRGEGKIIPSIKNQIVQHLEGGILVESFVKEGQYVKKGEVLMRVESVIAEMALEERQKQRLALIAAKTRLTAESEGKKSLEFPSELLKAKNSSLVTSVEQDLFNQRLDGLNKEINILVESVRQKQTEYSENLARKEQLKKQLEIAKRERSITLPLVQQNLAPKLDMIKIEEKINDVESRIEGIDLSLPRTESTISEAKQRIESRRSQFKSEALKELSAITGQLERLENEIAGKAEVNRRSELVSPINGTINKVMASTIGGVIKGGQDIIEIVPIEENLIVEAKVQTKDRAYINIGNKAVVKLTAYDFAVHGGVNADVIDISADTFKDGEGPNSLPYYRVRLRTEKNNIGPNKPIVQGMQAQVDIKTGRRSVLNYFLKPVLRARNQALSER